MEIRVGKYRTRGGDVVDVTAIQDGGSWPVDGLLGGVMLDHGTGWRSSGRFYGDEDSQEDDRDLVERIEDGVEPDKFEITGPGEYRTRDGSKIFVTGRHGKPGWPWLGYEPFGGLPMTFTNEGGYHCNGMQGPRDIVGPWIEEATPVEGDGEFAPPVFVEVSAQRQADAEPEPCDYRESAETLAAALRNLLASLPEVVSVKTGDAATLARLALEGFAP